MPIFTPPVLSNFLKNRCKFIAIFIALVFSSLAASAQFHTVHTETAVDYARKLSFYSPNEGYVAFASYVGYTIDSGKTFVQKKVTASNVDYNGYPINLTFGFNIEGVRAVNKDIMFVYGDYGYQPTILYSTDQGNNFKVVFNDSSGTLASIYDLTFPQNDNVGYAVCENRVLKTIDGGLTWSISLSGAGSNVASLQFLDDSQGFVFGRGANLYRTTDGGGHWQSMNKPAGTLSSAAFINSTRGWITNNDGTVYLTTDGGASWNLQNPQPLAPVSIRKMQFMNDSTGYALTQGFEVYKTTNSGKIWERLPRINNYSYGGYTLLDFQFLNNVTWASGGVGYIEVSNNNGGTPIPDVNFSVDTSGVWSSGIVNLHNYSKPGSKDMWTVNGNVVSNAYNASYKRNVFKLTDTIRLITSNSLYSDTLTQYAYFNPPIFINSFTPVTGGAGTVVTITGLNFIDVASVRFGNVLAKSFSVVSQTEIVAVVDTGASGAVAVSCYQGVGSKAGFTFIPPPSVTSFSPLTAKAGTTITLTGKYFNNTTTVTFGGIPATSFTVVSPTQITAVVGSGDSGDVAVTSAGGTGTMSGFTMIPVINSFTPTSGTNGTVISIAGTGLDHATAVTIGGVAALSFNVDSAAGITAIVGAGATGNVVVTGPGGIVTSGLFTYYQKPTVTSLSPLSGPAGTVVTITGTNFSTVPAENNVTFGAVQANVISATSTSLTVKAPAGLTYAQIIVETHHLVAYAPQAFTNSFPGGGGFGVKTFNAPYGATITSTSGIPPVVADIDGDGKPDIVTGQQYADYMSVMLNTGTIGKVSYVQKDFTHINALGFIVLDMDGDGKPDLVAMDVTTERISVYRNISTPGNVAFDLPVAMSNYYSDFSSVRFGVYDMDGDGKPDIVMTDINGGTFYVYRNKSEPGKPAFYPLAPLNVGSGYSFAINDLDGDGKPDFLIPGGVGGDPTYFLRNTSTPGNFSFAPAKVFDPGLSNLLGLADIDGDGKFDIVTISENSNQLAIYRNLSTPGDISYANPVVYPTGVQPVNMAVGDLDGDGKADIAVNNIQDKNISVFKNISTPGNIQLLGAVNYAVPPQADALSIADLNGDGKNDLLFSTGAGQAIVTFVNDGRPSPMLFSFTPTHGVQGDAITLTGQSFTGATSVKFGGVAATSFTVNSDQSITAILGNGASGSVSVTGTYDTSVLPGFAYGQPPIIQSFAPLSGPIGTSVTITGKYFDPLPANNIVYFGGAPAQVTSSSPTQLVVTVPVGATYQPISVVVNNLIGYANLSFDVTFPNGQTSFNQNSFTAKLTIPGNNGIVGDFDGDGFLDLAYISYTGNLEVARNNGLKDSLSFAPGKFIKGGVSVRRLYVADIDADGKLDIITINSSPSNISIYKNTSTGGNISFAAPVIVDNPQVSLNFTGLLNIAIADVDGDGLPDIAGANYELRSVSLYHNKSANGIIAFEKNVDYDIGAYVSDVKFSDVNGDGKTDMIVAANSLNGVDVFTNASVPGTIIFGLRTGPPGNDYTGHITAADLDGDGKPDVIVSGILDGKIMSIYHNTSTGGAISWTQTDKGAGLSPLSETFADLNGDGKPEFLLNDLNNNLNIYQNSSSPGNISFLDKDDFFMPGHDGWSYTSVGDLDQDGKPDLVVSGYNDITIYSNKPRTLFTLPDTNFKVQFAGSSCNRSKNGTITITAAQSLPYTATITGPAYNLVKTFTQALNVTDLDTGAYSVCITVNGQPDFQQCFGATLTEPKNISVYAVVNTPGQTVDITMGGGQNYTVQLNDVVYHTNQPNFTAPLLKGNNELTVTTDKQCQGVYKQRITIGNDITIYPNPFVGAVQMDVGTSQAPVGKVEIVDMMGKQVFVDNAVNNEGKLNLDLSGLESGVYVVKLTIDNKQTVYKIWKR